MIPPDKADQFEQLHGCQFVLREADGVTFVRVNLPPGNNKISHIQDFLEEYGISHHITYIDAGNPSSPFHPRGSDSSPTTNKG